MLLHLIANAAAILLTAIVLQQFGLPNEIYYRDYQAVAIFAVVLGLFNAVLTPILNILTFPLACLTFGLFRIVVNIVVFLLAGALLPDDLLRITPLGATVGALVAGVASGVLTLALGEGRR
jgi:putative membrane protein